MTWSLWQYEDVKVGADKKGYQRLSLKKETDSRIVLSLILKTDLVLKTKFLWGHKT
jgi:hypothetical protein